MVAARLLPIDSERRQRVGRYELIGEIASGGMATVYLGRRSGEPRNRELVAVKRLHPHLAEEEDFVRMFFEEARVAALIHHPNVVPIYDVGSSDAGYYLVMQYIEGDTLARRLTDCAASGALIPLRIGLRIVVDMLLGLHAAHEVKDEHGLPLTLVHRDVSPQNVLVGLDGVARIMDFGLAKAASSLPGTHAGQLKGKIAYMAPEQAAGEELVDRRTDVFASGIVLWELLTGRRLFRAANDAATLSRVVNERIEPPSSYVTGLAPSISDLCMRALERRLSLRIGTALEFAEQLESAAALVGALATRVEVAVYMHATLGPAMTQQRLAVDQWLDQANHVDAARAQDRQRELPDSRRGWPRRERRFSRSRSNSSDLAPSSRLRRSRRRWSWGRAGRWLLLVLLAVIASWYVTRMGPQIRNRLSRGGRAERRSSSGPTDGNVTRNYCDGPTKFDTLFG